MAEFFAMDGYAVFVWGSYGATVLGVVGLIGLALNRRKSAEARLRRLQGEKD